MTYIHSHTVHITGGTQKPSADLLFSPEKGYVLSHSSGSRKPDCTPTDQNPLGPSTPLATLTQPCQREHFMTSMQLILK